ncbi:hypothetical protein [Vibrio phage vB_ValS_PJ32]|nr:hypothetical protein [Vibrio phage vB_ValS_PJ32]
MFLSIEDVKTNPVFKKAGFDDLPLKKVTKALSLTCSAAQSKLRADRCALSFYAQNHIFSDLCSRKLNREPLTGKEAAICSMYEDTIADQTRFIFAYLTLASIREARHVMDLDFTSADVNDDIVRLFEAIKGIAAKDAVDYFIFSDINCTIGELLKALEAQFIDSEYANGYGGDAWADIAKCCLMFAEGELTAELFVDQAYHLEHNNGSVFNKNFIFSDEKPDLQKVLDCQAAGQAPNLLANPTAGHIQYVGPQAVDPEIHALVKDKYDPVNWDIVFKRGIAANGKYTSFLESAQVSNKPAVAVAMDPAKPGSDKTIVAKGNSKYKATGLTVTPYHNFNMLAFTQER